ncbi:MAG: hypothetical protein IPH12_04680 [Saprospirales bacterium]|nr:hypothetical protein [Saprospirales bacterium]MBK8920360.1 hypothetical protein [Saprospirales bacterium]
MTNYKKQIGIWLDYKEAFLVIIDEEKGGAPEVRHILSNIEWGVAKGGSHGKSPWAPQGGINEQAFMARRQKEEKIYFESILREIDPDTCELLIFGPAEAKLGLQRMIGGIKHYRPEVKAVITAGAMTRNQIVAQVRVFFAEKVA